MYRLIIIALGVFILAGCANDESISEYYLDFGSFLFVRFIDGENIILEGRTTRKRDSYGLYKTSIDKLGDPLSYTKFGNIRGLEKQIGSRGVITPRENIGDSYLIMSGDTKYLSIRGTGLYSLKGNNFNWDPPVNGYYEYLGTSRNKQSLLLKTEKLVEIPPESPLYSGPGGMLPMTQSSSIVEYDLKTKKISSIYESKEFQRPLESKEFFDLGNCSPYHHASGSPDGKTIIIAGRKLNDVCRLYLLDLKPGKKQVLKELETLGAVGGVTEWSQDGEYFIMACGPSEYCRYSPEGKLEKILSYKHDNLYMTDYNSESDLLLLTLNVKDREDRNKYPYFVIIKFHSIAEDYSFFEKLKYVFK